MLFPRVPVLPHRSFLETQMGFRPEVDRFQPFYTFNDKHVSDLRIGAAILHEALQTAGKEEDEGLKVREAKAEEEMRIKRAKEAFLEDRKTQALRAERERFIRSQEGTAQALSRTRSPIPGAFADDPESDSD